MLGLILLFCSLNYELALLDLEQLQHDPRVEARILVFHYLKKNMPGKQ